MKHSGRLMVVLFLHDQDPYLALFDILASKDGGKIVAAPLKLPRSYKDKFMSLPLNGGADPTSLECGSDKSGSHVRLRNLNA